MSEEMTFRDGLRRTAWEWWVWFPSVVVTTMAFTFGLALFAARMEFTDPIVPRWYARQFFRVIGLFIMWCPVWHWWRKRRGFYDGV